MNKFLKITPLDTLFFRDGKPFSMGSETWADGVFPPFPSTILGAIRSWCISNHPDGPTDDTIDRIVRDVEIAQMAYFVNNEVYYPLPMDFAIKKDQKPESVKTAVNLKLAKAEAVIASNYPCSNVLLNSENVRVESQTDGLLPAALLKTYLRNNLYGEVNQVKFINSLLLTEPKTGIGRENLTLTAKESMLYRVGMVRATGFSFIVEVTLPDYLQDSLQRPNVIKLGAEGKLAKVEVVEDKLIINRLSKSQFKIELNDEDREAPCRFRLYLNTPGVFKNGWYPNLEKHGIEAKLVCAALGKPLFVGGYDMKMRKPKPMLRAVPAGSVYFFESETLSLEEVVNRLAGTSLSETISFVEATGQESIVEPQREGFGIAYVGRW